MRLSAGVQSWNQASQQTPAHLEIWTEHVTRIRSLNFERFARDELCAQATAHATPEMRGANEARSNRKVGQKRKHDGSIQPLCNTAARIEVPHMVKMHACIEHSH